jgi:hypothetical protein
MRGCRRPRASIRPSVRPSARLLPAGGTLKDERALKYYELCDFCLIQELECKLLRQAEDNSALLFLTGCCCCGRPSSLACCFLTAFCQILSLRKLHSSFVFTIAQHALRGLSLQPILKSARLDLRPPSRPPACQPALLAPLPVRATGKQLRFCVFPSQSLLGTLQNNQQSNLPARRRQQQIIYFIVF